MTALDEFERPCRKKNDQMLFDAPAKPRISSKHPSFVNYEIDNTNTNANPIWEVDI